MSAKTYVRRPIKVEAMQLWPTTVGAVKEWAGDAVRILQPGNVGVSGCSVMVNDMIEANGGDWIIKRQADQAANFGEFYVMSPYTFAATYEEAK